MKNHFSSFNWKQCLRALAVGFNVLVAMSTVFTGYSGCIDPDVMPFAGLAGMTFAGWVVLSVLLLIVNLIFCRKLAVLPALALLCTIGPILTFSPINRKPRELTPEEQRRSFKVLNYNVLSFYDDPQKQESDSVNRTMQYIMDSGADVVCLQECYFLIPFEHYGLYQPQIDSLKEIYPYYFVGRQGQTVLSKYPFMNIPLPKDHMDAGDFAAYRMNIKGHPITIFNVHLQSIGLTVGDQGTVSGVDRRVARSEPETCQGAADIETVSCLPAACASGPHTAQLHRAVGWQCGAVWRFQRCAGVLCGQGA